jgi:hydroxysqualene dehydroxylase
MKIAIIGAGWAGLACAVRATQLGHNVTLFETSRTLGGRARAIDHHGTRLDNGQHILIGAYTDTLALLRTVGVDLEQAFLRRPLSLQDPAGLGLQLPLWLDRPDCPRWLRWASPLDGIAGIVLAKGWSVRDKLSLLRHAVGWQLSGFRCKGDLSVAKLCQSLPQTIRDGFIDPLCVSALNTPADRASAQVFLTVLKDALFGPPGSSNLLLPRTDLGQLLPDPAARWLTQHGCTIRLGHRVTDLEADLAVNLEADLGADLHPQPTPFDHIVLATPSTESARLLAQYATKVDSKLSKQDVPRVLDWANTAQAIPFEAIATVYAEIEVARGGQDRAPRDAPITLPSGTRLGPMSALQASTAHPAQFVFDRGQLGGQPGQLAFVVSAATGDAATLTQQVVAQAKVQLGLTIKPFKTIIEKRATFACLPGLARPKVAIAPGLSACGDYLEGPYPATLEGAVRSGNAAAHGLGTVANNLVTLASRRY